MKEVTYADSVYYGASGQEIDRTMSYFAQAGYSYDNRYYFKASFRMDGTSEFSKHVNWSPFASAGVSWNIHNEKFYNIGRVVNQLKLRTSLGTTRNSRVSSSMVSLGSYQTSDSYRYDGSVGATISEIANPDFKWEKTRKFNVGLDIGLFDRASISFEYYNNKTTDLIAKLPVSRVLGTTSVYRNVGALRNEGFEMTFDYAILSNKKLYWSIDGNLSLNRNKILELYMGESKSFGSTVWMEGYDKSTHMLIRWAGVDPRDGSPMWYDKNGNLTSTYDYDNRVPYKTSMPDFYGGIGTTLSYAGFTLTVRVLYSVGGYTNSSIMSDGLSDGYSVLDNNQAVEQLNYWKRPGDIATNTAFVYNNQNKARSYNTRFLMRKTYINLSNVALRYSVPKRIANAISMNNLDVALIGDNLFYWVPGSSSNKNSYKTVMSDKPIQRVFSINLTTSF